MNLKVNDTVLVPEPEMNDMWNHEFVGTIVAIKNELATVEDMDGDCFDVETERLSLELL